MSTITGTWKAGHVVLDGVADWPEGCRVLVEPLSTEHGIGLAEADWLDSPEAIADWLQWYDSLEPLEITPEERTDWTSWQRQLRQFDHARGYRRIEGLFE